MVAGGRNERGVGTGAFDSSGALGALTAVILIALTTTICVLLAGCATQPPSPPALIAPAPPTQVTSVMGVASWYGPGFHGHRTSSGAVYDQEDLTAASTLFPLGTHLLVTNLANRHAVEVTVNDHGPYVKGRQIDLSRKAARVLGVIGPGTAHVRMDVLATPAGGPAIGERFFVQVGSFADPGNAPGAAAPRRDLSRRSCRDGGGRRESLLPRAHGRLHEPSGGGEPRRPHRELRLFRRNHYRVVLRDRVVLPAPSRRTARTRWPSAAAARMRRRVSTRLAGDERQTLSCPD